MTHIRGPRVGNTKKFLYHENPINQGEAMKTHKDKTVQPKERKVAKRLLDLRVERGLSQGALADKAGVDRKTVNRIENDHFSPNLNTFIRLCKALKVKPSQVLENI